MSRPLELVFSPAIRLASRLSLAWKIALVCAVLIVPTLLLGYGYRSGMRAQTSFAANEQAGIAYAKPLMDLLASTVELRSADVRGTTDASARSAIDADVDTLDELVAKNAGGMDVAKQWNAAKAAVSAYADRAPTSSPATEIAAADRPLATTNAAVSQVLNNSFLILDPDLDSYSAMDGWLLRMPVVLDLATRSSAQLAAALPHGGHAGRAVAVELAQSKARLDDALTAVNADVSAAAASTRDKHAAAELQAPVGPLSAALAQLDASLTAGMDGTLQHPSTSTGDAVARAAVALDKAYPVTLDRLVQERADRLNARLDRDLAIAALCLLLAAYMVAAIVLQIRSGIAPVLDRARRLVDHCVSDLRTGLQRMSAGDLTYDIAPSTPPIEDVGQDEIGTIATALNEMREYTVASVEAYNATRSALADLVGSIQAASGTVSSASEQMAATSAETGRAIGEIATAVGGIAQGAERQVRMVETTRRSAEDTASEAGEARRVALEGVDAATEATDAIQALQESTERITTAIRALETKSEQIGGIVETITGIAGQTNLLALNAAIEAARAGEQGRGFAVVAEEVRKLAEESQQAAAEIAGLIDEIQHETHATVEAVEDGAERTRESVTVVERSREAFQQIGVQIEEVTSRIAEIVTAAGEVASVAEESSASTEQVSASTQETSATTQQIAASAQDLAATAEQLRTLVGTFTIEITSKG